MERERFIEYCRLEYFLAFKNICEKARKIHGKILATERFCENP